MSPRKAEPGVREALVDAAARLLADGGPSALSTRRLAAEVGTSTMAVYTHFGGMDELIRAVVWEGFERLAARLGAVVPSEDPVADTIRLGGAYRRHATTDPNLYSVMFGGHGMGGYLPTDEDRVHGLATFETLAASVARCMDAGRFDAGEPVDAALRIWTALHGAVTLELAGFLADMADVDATYRGLAVTLATGLGDDRAAAARSVHAALG